MSIAIGNLRSLMSSGGYLKLILQSVRRDGERKYALPYVVPQNARLIVNAISVTFDYNTELTVDFRTSIRNITISANKPMYAVLRLIGGTYPRYQESRVTIGMWDGTNFTSIAFANAGDDGAAETDGATRLIVIDPLSSPVNIGSRELMIRVYLRVTSAATGTTAGLYITSGSDDSFVLIPVEGF